MPFMVAAVILVGIVGVLNLVLMVGVIRRLRAHTELLGGLPGPTARVLEPTIPVGTTIGPFAATTTEGEPVSRELLAGPVLVGFFSPRCKPCKEKLPGFVERAAAMPEGRRHVLAVVAGDPSQATDMATALAAVARVVVEPDGGPVATAFGVRGFPVFCLIDGGNVVTASGFDLAALAIPAAA